MAASDEDMITSMDLIEHGMPASRAEMPNLLKDFFFNFGMVY